MTRDMSVWLWSNLRNSGRAFLICLSFQIPRPRLSEVFPDTSFPSFNLVPICCPVNYRPFSPLTDHRNQSFKLGMGVCPCTGKAKQEGQSRKCSKTLPKKKSAFFHTSVFFFIPTKNFIKKEVQVICKAEGPGRGYCHATDFPFWIFLTWSFRTEPRTLDCPQPCSSCLDNTCAFC